MLQKLQSVGSFMIDGGGELLVRGLICLARSLTIVTAGALSGSVQHFANLQSILHESKQ